MAKQYGGEISQGQKDSAKKIGKYVIIVIVILLVLWLCYLTWYQYNQRKNQEPVLISKPQDATKAFTASSSDLPTTSTGSEYGYSFWIYVSDWTYRFGQAKSVLWKGDSSCNSANPSIWLYPKENKLMVRCEAYSYNPADGRYSNPEGSMNPLQNPSLLGVEKSCDIDNIPLQRWVHVGVSLWNRTLDVYINGKLTRSCVLPGVAKLNKGNIYTTAVGGYQGYISRLQYFNHALSPDYVYGLYRKGPFSANWWWSSVKGSIPNINCSATTTNSDGTTTTIGGSCS